MQESTKKINRIVKAANTVTILTLAVQFFHLVRKQGSS